ncbi:hypothetical protein BH24DEI1_BH24DEI1_09880 [soil metagenome]|jgi:hypothetical protein|nr:hypothetical protein [Deinococcota bacterium]
MFFRRGNPNFKHDGNFLLARVRTDKSGEVIAVRISKTSEMSPQGGGYFVRKVLLGSKSLDQAVIEISLGRNHGIKQATVDGGMLVPVKEWRDE